MATLTDHARIRVEVMPLGNIGNGRFQALFRSLCSLWQFSLKEISPFPTTGFNWHDGTLMLDFEVSEKSKKIFDGCSLQPYQKTMAIVGFCDCSNVDRLELVEEEFQAHVKTINGNVISRWCAINMTEAQLNTSDSLQRLIENGMVIFPPEKMTDDGRTTVDMHMAVMLSNICNDILRVFDAIITEGQKSLEELSHIIVPASSGITGMTFTGFGKKILGNSSAPKAPPSHVNTVQRADSFLEDALGALYESMDKDDKLVSKRQAGRIGCWVASNMLLAGCYYDALQLFNSAIVECRTSKDDLWQAIALEGSASALFLWRLDEKNTGDATIENAFMTTEVSMVSEEAYNAVTKTDPGELFDGSEVSVVKMIPDVRAALLKAANLYSKSNASWPMECNASMKLARYLAKCGGRYRSEAIHILNVILRKGALEIAAPRSLNNIKVNEQPNAWLEKHEKELEFVLRDLYIQSAIIFQHFGMHRKAGFLLKQACHNEPNWDSACELLQCAAMCLGVTPKYTNSVKSGEIKTKSWTSIKASILNDLVDITQNADKRNLSIDYALQLLELASSDRALNVHLSQRISSCANFDGFFRLEQPTWFPKIVFDGFAKKSKAAKFHKSTSFKKNEESKFFIPSGSTSKAEAYDSVWVQGEVQLVRLKTANPVEFALQLDTVELLFSDVDGKPVLPGTMEFQPTTINLSSHSKETPCEIYVRPLVPGTYYIQGVMITFFGLASEVIFEPQSLITVLPPMPCLEMSSFTCKQGLDLQNTPLVLYEGERIHVDVEMRSQSQANVEQGLLSAVVSYAPPTHATNQTVTYGKDVESLISAVASHKKPRVESSGVDYLLTHSSKLETQLPKVQTVFENFNDAQSSLQSQIDSEYGCMLPLSYSASLHAVRDCKRIDLCYAYSMLGMQVERHCTIRLDISILKSFEIRSVQIRSLSFAEVLVCVDIHNHTTRDQCQISAISTDNQKVLSSMEIPHSSIRRMMLQVRKPERMPSNLKSWISGFLQIQWKFLRSSRGGVIPLPDDTNIYSGLDLLAHDIIDIQVEVDSKSFRASIRNLQSNVCLKQLVVSFELMTPIKCFFSGTMTHLIHELDPESEHTCSVYYTPLMNCKPNGLALRVSVTENGGEEPRSWTKEWLDVQVKCE